MANTSTGRYRHNRQEKQRKSMANKRLAEAAIRIVNPLKQKQVVFTWMRDQVLLPENLREYPMFHSIYKPVIEKAAELYTIMKEAGDKFMEKYPDSAELTHGKKGFQYTPPMDQVK
jgi:hypothetical protein